MSKKSYFEKLQDPRWQKKRLRILERDGFKCVDCRSGKNSLQVHHCHYGKGEPWEVDDSVLITLCAACHQLRGDHEADAKKALGIIMARLRDRVDDDAHASFVRSLLAMAEAEGEIYPLVVDEREMIALWEKANLPPKDPKA